MKEKMKKGFTLIELLIVIGILAILATAVILVLNPAQLLAQARDSQRISDLSSVKSAIGLYLATADSPAIAASSTCTATGCNNPFTLTPLVVTSSTSVTGTGWVAINLSGTAGGSSLSSLPLDPTNNSTYFYGFAGDSTNKTFELDGRLESTKYRDQMTSDGGNKDVCGTDYGGSTTSSTCFYEIGTAAGLSL